MKQLTGDEAKQRILRQVAIQRREYKQLWQRYREVVHENALLNAENDRLRRKAHL